MTIQISDFTNEHLPTTVRLLNDEYKGSYEFIPYDEERVLSEIRKRHFKVLAATENGTMQGVIATHTHEEEQLEEHVSWLAAREGFDRASIERILVAEVERNTKGNIVMTMVDEGSSRINDWTKWGYTLYPGYQRMSAELHSLRSIPKLPEEIMLRSLRPDEEEKLVTVMNAGFGWQRLEPGILETWKYEDPPFNEDWVQVAAVGERMVSAVVAKPDTDHMKYLHLKRGHLGPAATLPEFRNKHLASALTAKAMNFLFEKGMDSVRLGTGEWNVASKTLLGNLGFHVDVVHKIMRKELKRQ